MIQEYYKKVYNKYYEYTDKNEPLLWVLIKFFGLNKEKPESLNQLQTFERVQTYQRDGLDLQEHRIQFIVTLSLFNFLQHTYNHQPDYRSDRVEQFKSMSITVNHMTRSAVLYMNQLLREGDWQQALLITSFIPSSNMKIRKYLVFSIL